MQNKFKSFLYITKYFQRCDNTSLKYQTSLGAILTAALSILLLVEYRYYYKVSSIWNRIVYRPTLLLIPPCYCHCFYTLLGVNRHHKDFQSMTSCSSWVLRALKCNNGCISVKWRAWLDVVGRESPSSIIHAYIE